MFNSDRSDHLYDGPNFNSENRAKASERLRMNHNFHESPEAPSQRMLNALEVGTKVPVHKHDKTAETYILLRGSIRVDYHSPDGATITESVTLNPLQGNYGLNIPAGQLHSLQVLEPGTVIFECKDGPYIPL